jgi:hypothetical protein
MIRHHAHPMPLPVCKMPLVFRPIVELKNPLPILLIVLEWAFVDGAVFPCIHPIPMSLVLLQLPFKTVSISILKLPLSVLPSKEV